MEKKKIAIGAGILLLLGGLVYLLTRKPKTPKETLKDVFDNLSFEFGKAVILPSSFPYLDELADVLSKDSTWKLRIVGHTDNVGSDTANQKLSEKRAIAVSNYLVTKGIDASRITAEGKGETMPIASNDTPEGREKNRRVEFFIAKASEAKQ